jgi:mercuric ion binding protein
MKLLLASLFILISTVAFAQDKKSKKEAEVKIQTSSVCKMCKATIEKDMIFEKGVKNSNLDVETGVLTVTYVTRKTDPQAIRERITKIGYHADTLKRDHEAFQKLPDCCQRPDIHSDKK